jgi:hypothetical protein
VALGSQCPRIVATAHSNKTLKPSVEPTSMLFKPLTTASNYKKVLRTTQPRTDSKYKSTGFEKFQNLGKTKAKMKIEYYKLHKSIFDSKMDQERMNREEQEMYESIMPIYSKADIIQIKNKNLHPVL